MSAELVELREEIRGLRVLVEAVAVALRPAAQSRPLTALELMDRWAVRGKTPRHRLYNLAELCRARGLAAMPGTRGLGATYMVADVVAAEDPTLRRRRVGR